MSYTNWGEFKAALAAAGVRDEDDVDVRSFEIDTDRCNCPNLAESDCQKPDEHLVWTVYVNGEEVELLTLPV